MLLNELHTDWRQDHTYTFKLGLIEYQCKVKFLPFSTAKAKENEETDLTKIYTPVYHLEFEFVNTSETIYQSHWIMPYFLAWFLENYPDHMLHEMVRFVAKESGFTERIAKANQELQRGTQLSIF